MRTVRFGNVVITAGRTCLLVSAGIENSLQNFRLPLNNISLSHRASFRPLARNRSAVRDVIYTFSNVGGVIANALNVLSTKYQIHAETDIACIFQHGGEELAKDDNIESVNFLIFLPNVPALERRPSEYSCRGHDEVVQ